MAAELAANENRDLSPLTGQTREHWIEMAERMVAGVMQYVDPATGVPHLPADPGETGLETHMVNSGGLAEAFDRTMMLAAFWAKASGRTTVDGFDGDVMASYRLGIDHAINEMGGSRGRGSPLRDGSIVAMLAAPELLLDPLEESTRAALGDLLSRYVGGACRDNNTLLFRMMPAPLLERLGREYNRPLLDDHFDAILSMYRGDGWFIDGWNRGFDHYNFWGFQFYLHALMHFDSAWHEQYAERIREITAAHERTLPYYYGRDGAPVPKGRSINYRFAVLSGIGMAQLSGLATMSPGQARRISSGCLRYFWDRGCLSDRGLLERGYFGVNGAVGEDYTDTGAPYWATSGLAALLLPEDHAFWTAEEEPIAADTPGVKRCAIPGAEMVLKVDGDRGEARMIVAGEPFLHRRIWQAGAKYYQHTMSSTLGYAVVGEGGPQLAAGRTGISIDGDAWTYRTWPRCRRVDPLRVRGEWDAWPATEGMTGMVITETLILDHGEVHVFWHTAEEPRYLTLGGYAVHLEHSERPMMDLMDDGLAVAGDATWSVMAGLRTVPGRFAMDEVHPSEGFEHAHLFGGWAAYPRWTSANPVPPGGKLAFFVDAARRSETPDIETPDIAVDDSTEVLRITVNEETFEV